MLRIAIQGGYGAFHEIAAHHYFSSQEVEVIPRDTFRDMFRDLNQGAMPYGITAIENSLAGSILPNYALLHDSEMQIVGEIYLRIRQNLVALHGVKAEDLEEVLSHPMAILQCQDFFDAYPRIKLTESPDTALSAKKIADENLPVTGAIASERAARKYGLNMLAESIETNKDNYTRFLILSKNAPPKDQRNKATLQFRLSHEIGSLSKVLTLLSFYDINLTKIQSLPVVGKSGEYQFYIDVVIHDYTRYQQALQGIRPFTSELTILGEYKQGIQVSA